MRSFAAGFWCALAVVALVLVVRKEEALPPAQAPAVPASVTPAEAPPEPEPLRPLVAQEARYSGNANTHRFHELSCRYASCPNCIATFATREEAIAAGFRPGGCCNP